MKKTSISIAITAIIVSSFIIYKNEMNFFGILKTNAKVELQEPNNESNLIKRGIQNNKEVKKQTVVDVTKIKNEASLEISKTGISKPNKEVKIQAETNGKVTNINVKTGQEVKKGTKLATLGNSMSTKLLDLQYTSALKNIESAKKTKALTEQSKQQSLNTLNNAIKSAEINYKKAKENKTSKLNILELQKESAENKLDTLKDQYKSTKKNYYDLINEIKKTEDEIKSAKQNTSENTDLISILNQKLIELQTQKNTLKTTKETLKDNIENAENGIEQIEENINNQENNLDYAIDIAKIQLQNSKNQLTLTTTQTDISLEQLNSSITQADLQINQIEAQKEQQLIKSTISGVISSISIKEGNLASAGQVLMTITDNSKTIINTSINTNESKYINEKTKAVIVYENEEIECEIKSISPNLNKQTMEFDVELTTKKSIPANANLEIKFKPTISKILIPINTITPENNSYYIFKVENKKAVKTKVKTGEIINEFIEITNGLKPNDVIINSQHSDLNNGDSVLITN